MNDELWYSKFSELNDPFEGLYINNTSEETFDSLLASLGVCCFSKSNKSLLMWSHYADSHKGICIQYEINKTQYKTQFFDVDYHRPTRPVLNEIRRYASGHKSEGALQIDIENEGAIFRTKSPDWEYEEEIRSLVVCKDGHSKGRVSKIIGKVTAIYFGLRSSLDTQKIIGKILPNRDEVAFYKTTFLGEGYHLDFMETDKPKT